MDEAVAVSCDFLEHLSPECIIYRVGGNGHPQHAIAPEWVWQKKRGFSQALDQEFIRRQTRQGSKMVIFS
jgi:hypothetical protein